MVVDVYIRLMGHSIRGLWVVCVFVVSDHHEKCSFWLRSV